MPSSCVGDCLAFLGGTSFRAARQEQISNVCPGGDSKMGSNAGIGGTYAGVADSER